MNDSIKLIDICDSLSSMCQALVHGSRLRFKCNQHEMSAEEAFAAGNLFLVFLDIALKMPPDDESLRVAQCKNFNTVFDIQAIVPSYLGSVVENKWEDRLRKLIASFKAQGSQPDKTIDLSGHFSDFAISISTDKIPTFNNVESALKHFRGEDVKNDVR